MARTVQSNPVPASPPVRPLWRGPLVAGLCFGLAYGVTQRLFSFNVGELIRFGSGFDVQVFPGTSLESLKLRFGDAEAEIQGDLELQELERQQQDEAKRREQAAKQAEAELQRSAQPELEAPPQPDLPPAATAPENPGPTEPPAPPAAQP